MKVDRVPELLKRIILFQVHVISIPVPQSIVLFRRTPNASQIKNDFQLIDESIETHF